MRNSRVRTIDHAWETIFKACEIDRHDFKERPFRIKGSVIKHACRHFIKAGEKEVGNLCKQYSRESRPQVFVEQDLFLLPVENGIYQIVKGEGYVDIPDIETPLVQYDSQISFDLETFIVGDSERRHLDCAYVLSLIRNFVEDDSLVLTIRGRKYTPPFSFRVGEFNIDVASVQTEISAGYEGRDRVVLVKVKNGQLRNTKNTIIRQLYYPYRKWREHIQKQINVLFFESVMKSGGNLEYHIREFEFTEPENYNSIRLRKSARYIIKQSERIT